MFDCNFLQSLLDICIENVGELIRSNFGKEVIYEVIAITLIFKSYKLNLLRSIAFLINSMAHAGCDRGI